MNNFGLDCICTFKQINGTKLTGEKKILYYHNNLLSKRTRKTQNTAVLLLFSVTSSGLVVPDLKAVAALFFSQQHSFEYLFWYWYSGRTGKSTKFSAPVDGFYYETIQVMKNA